MKYLDAIQAHYDGVKPDDERWKQIIESHQKEIIEMGKQSPDGDLVEIIDNKHVTTKRSPRTVRAEELLNKYMKAVYFMPSYHMVEKGKCYLLDIRIKDNREQTADKILKENKKYYECCVGNKPHDICTAGYKIGLDDKSGDPHIHLCLRKDYKPN